MKKHLLSLPLLSCLLFAGCTPDEGIDMPMPENTLAKEIQGSWQLYESSVTYDEGLEEPVVDTDTSKQTFRFDGHTLYFATESTNGPEYGLPGYVGWDIFEEGNTSPYYLIDQNDQTLIQYDSSLNPKGRTTLEPHGQWIIDSITDSTMVWTQKHTGMYGVIVRNEFETDYDFTYKFRKKE